MAGKLGLEARMTIKELKRRGLGNSEIARMLDVTEGAVRYHLARQARGAVDGRATREQLASRFAEAIDRWRASLEEEDDDAPVNLAALHGWLVSEHDYPGTLRSVQRYFKARYPTPKRRGRRRVETPPGGQAQVDWAEFRGVVIDREPRDLFSFHMKLSWSRRGATVWSDRKHQLAWLSCHNGSFERLGGIAASVRVDNEKTAVVRGAGPWGTLNETYRTYASSLRFHIDPCLPRSPQHKGKVERAILDDRGAGDIRRRHWESLEELQAYSDERDKERAATRRCPVTGTSVLEAWEQEREHLQPVPILPEPFDLVSTRTVAIDATVPFEGRTYSVPMRHALKEVEIRGCARTVQILAQGSVVATWPRHTAERLLIDPRHYDDEGNDLVLPPPPLGRMGRRLREIAEMTPEQRPVDLYAALAEAAR